MTQVEIREILQNVQDPQTGISIIDRDFVKNISVEDQLINIEMLLPDKISSDQKVKLINYIEQLIKSKFNNAQVNIHFARPLPGQSASTNPLPQIKNIIAVGSGKGGVGKSTVAVNMALTLKNKGYRVGLMDADLYGPSIPTMLGMQGQKPKVEKVYGIPKIVPLKKYGLHLISVGFVIEPEQAIVLRGPRLGGILKQFIQECLWPELDYLIIDLPPGTGDIQLTLVQTIPVTGAVIVTTPQQVAVDDALKAMNMFLLTNVNVPILGIVENMSWFTPAELPGNKYFLFGQGGGKKLAKLGKSTMIGQIPLVQGVREGGDAGTPIALDENHPTYTYFDQMTNHMIREVDVRNEYAPTKVVQVKS
ncbi:UNVERIFIED_CONTAM: hypothetical protein GTU68_054063 [Idotea baltica]|nr:hypothetical protein [Idotea baltica]